MNTLTAGAGLPNFGINLQGITEKVHQEKEKFIASLKRLYKNTFLNHFYTVLTGPVE